jgi:hypothetical protein
MRTLVIQAWTGDRPRFIDRCLETARAWSDLHGFEYRFETDALLADVPDSYRRAVSGLVMPMTNYGRLLLLRRALQSGYDRAVWCDADVVIFDPAALHLHDVHDYALTREVWTDIDKAGTVRHDVNVAGCLMVFERTSPVLDFVLHALAQRAEQSPITEPRGSFTRMLTDLNKVVPLRTVRHVGMLSPLLLRELVRGTTRHVPGHMQTVGAPLCGVNLSAAFLDVVHRGLHTTESVYEDVIRRSLAGHGEVFNRHVSEVEVTEPDRAGDLAELLARNEDGAAERLSSVVPTHGPEHVRPDVSVTP